MTDRSLFSLCTHAAGQNILPYLGLTTTPVLSERWFRYRYNFWSASAFLLLVGQARLKYLEYMSHLMKNSFFNFGNSQKYVACFLQNIFGKTVNKLVTEFHFKHPPYCHSKTKNDIRIWHTQKHATRQLLMSWFGYWMLSLIVYRLAMLWR